MAIYYPGCQLTIPDPSCSDCPAKELGRVRHLALQLASYTWTDITNPAEWTTAINARNVFIFPRVKGTFTMSPNTSDSYGDIDTQLDTYTNTLELMDPNFRANQPFWNAIKNSYQYVPIWGTQNLLYQSAVPANIVPTFKVDDNDKSIVVWGIHMTMVQADLPTITTLPAGTFTRCAVPV